MILTAEDLCILDVNEYQKETNEFLLREKDKNNRFIMDLKIKIEGKEVYSLFCKKTSGKKETDNSKLLFLSFLNFPDGVYLELSDEQMKCHIIELKKSPKSKLDIIGKQFMSAKLHLISLFSIMGYDFTKVDINYYVGYVTDEISKVDQHNLQHQNMKKVIPGTSQAVPKRIEKWEDSKIIAGIGRYQFEEHVHKIKLDFSEVFNGYNVYSKEINLI